MGVYKVLSDGIGSGESAFREFMLLPIIIPMRMPIMSPFVAIAALERIGSSVRQMRWVRNHQKYTSIE